MGSGNTKPPTDEEDTIKVSVYKGDYDIDYDNGEGDEYEEFKIERKPTTNPGSTKQNSSPQSHPRRGETRTQKPQPEVIQEMGEEEEEEEQYEQNPNYRSQGPTRQVPQQKEQYAPKSYYQEGKASGMNRGKTMGNPVKGNNEIYASK